MRGARTVYDTMTGEVLAVITGYTAAQAHDWAATQGEQYAVIPGDYSPSEYRIVDGAPEPIAQPIPTLDEIKAAATREVNQRRDEILQTLSVEWDGSVFDANPESRQYIIGAAASALANPANRFQWVLADNTVRELTASEILELGETVAQRVGAVILTARGAKDLVASASDEGAVASIVEGITWP